jgi:hypothetical protein
MPFIRCDEFNFYDKALILQPQYIVVINSNITYNSVALLWLIFGSIRLVLFPGVPICLIVDCMLLALALTRSLTDRGRRKRRQHNFLAHERLDAQMSSFTQTGWLYLSTSSTQRKFYTRARTYDAMSHSCPCAHDALQLCTILSPRPRAWRATTPQRGQLQQIATAAPPTTLVNDSDVATHRHLTWTGTHTRTHTLGTPATATHNLDAHTLADTWWRGLFLTHVICRCCT